MNNEPLRVLQVIGAMDRGGAETLLMNLYRNTDRDRVQFDFLVNETRQCDYDEEISSLGGQIYRIPRFKILNYISYKKACRDFFSVHSYRIVHGHIGLPAAIYLNLAHESGAYAIAHSHAQNFPLSPEELAFRACSYPVRHHADYYIACSRQAGIDRFGIDIVNNGARFHLLKNGIDVERGRYRESDRERIRKELGISPQVTVFGHVGRLTPVKNHHFLFKVFSLIQQRKPDSVLLLAGRGEIEEELKAEARQLGIDGAVQFLGVREDIPSLLSAMDEFIFPSIKEGLPCAVVEAQASGLPCLISTGVPQLAGYRDQTEFLDLSLGADAWAERALLALSQVKESDRASACLDAVKAGFDIKDSAIWLQNFYMENSQSMGR